MCFSHKRGQETYRSLHTVHEAGCFHGPACAERLHDSWTETGT